MMKLYNGNKSLVKINRTYIIYIREIFYVIGFIGSEYVKCYFYGVST